MGARITALPHNSLPWKVFPSSYPPPVSKHSAHHLSMMMMMMIMLINSSILGDKFIKPYSLLIVNEKYITVYNRDLKGVVWASYSASRAATHLSFPTSSLRSCSHIIFYCPTIQIQVFLHLFKLSNTLHIGVDDSDNVSKLCNWNGASSPKGAQDI